MKNLIIATALLSISMTAQSGPFGLDMGVSLAELNKSMKLEPQESYSFTTSSPPNPHPDFNIYLLFVTPEHGLCKISAAGITVKTSIYGTELCEKFSGIESVLTNKYGKPARYDFLRSGSIWNEPKDWMMGLLKKERSIESYWTASNGNTNMPDNITTIRVHATALTTDKGWVSVSYEFKNSDQCLGWIRAQRASSL